MAPEVILEEQKEDDVSAPKMRKNPGSFVVRQSQTSLTLALFLKIIKPIA